MLCNLMKKDTLMKPRGLMKRERALKWNFKNTEILKNTEFYG